MDTETWIVAFEGDERKNVLDYAAEQAKRSGARLHVLHVLEWSPYTFLSAKELEERHARRKEELSRAHEAIIAPALARLAAAGVQAEGEIRYGQVVEIVVETAEKTGAAMIYVGRAGGNAFGARIFGSAPLGIAQLASVPTVIVP